MLDVLPFLAWLAAITSGVVLAVLWSGGELRPRSRLLLSPWFLLAAYLQFLGRSPVQSAMGLLLQTMLAVVLIVRSRLSG
jgi:hypothetical protein